MSLVRFDNVSKIYSRQSRQFFFRFLKQNVSRKAREPIYALRDMSFEISDGQSLAVIGHNGAGKSTILNLVAGLTIPERGSVHVDGRVMALLELGSGFHHDLTGAENLWLN
ncbi:MAG: ABC transporter ATP-binding protein, partial [bacterium]|nr:ABC transporter ATP-binding protein [bacterium]